MKKGFTLIELLAVILILGIIALIAIPTVNNIINEAKLKSFKTSMSNILKALENNCQVEKIKGDEVSKKYIIEDGVSNVNIEVSGKLPTTGVISVDNECKIEAYLSNGTYNLSKSFNEEELKENTNENSNNILTVYANGTPVYFNPTNGSICEEENVLTGVGNANGCMRWYIFNDEKGNANVDMILEHNIYRVLSYPGSLQKLGELEWVSGINPRMITKQEVDKITNNGNLNTIGEDGYSIYAWLYNYTINSFSNPCTVANCKYYGENSSLYWLNTKTENFETSNRVYAMAAGGLTGRVVGDGGVGLRPVITISKTLLHNT